MALHRKKRTDLLHDPVMPAMLDVVFNLMLFFALSQAGGAGWALPLVAESDRPVADGATVVEPPEVMVTVWNGKYHVDDKDYTLDELRPVLQARKDTTPNLRLSMYAGARSSLQDGVDLCSLCNELGIPKVELATRPKK